MSVGMNRVSESELPPPIVITNPWYSKTGEKNDQIKVQYCKENNLPLLLIYKGYNEQDILSTIRGWLSQ